MNKAPTSPITPEFQGKIHSLHLPHAVEEKVLKQGKTMTRKSIEMTLVGVQRFEHLDPQTIEDDLRRSGIHMSYEDYHSMQLSSGMVMHDAIDTLVEVRAFAQKAKRAQKQAV